MRKLESSLLWLLPVLGIGAGLIWAFIHYNGLYNPWLPVGQPGEAIDRITGLKGAERLVVVTENGSAYSLKFLQDETVLQPAQQTWQVEQDERAARQSADFGQDFATLTPRFRVSQLYKMEYLYGVEGKGEVHFALDGDGNLWMWDHHIVGLSGLMYFFYPAFGFLTGLGMVFLAVLITWIRSNRTAGGVQHVS